MTNSILNNTKKVLGLPEDYTVFDQDVLMHVNTAFATLNQLGLGPTQGFLVEDAAAEWADFIGADNRLNGVKSYVYLRTRLLFDPPQTSYLIEAMQRQVTELEWRLNVIREGDEWVDPNGQLPDDEEFDDVIDGGTV